MKQKEEIGGCVSVVCLNAYMTQKFKCNNFCLNNTMKCIIERIEFSFVSVLWSNLGLLRCFSVVWWIRRFFLWNFWWMSNLIGMLVFCVFYENRGFYDRLHVLSLNCFSSGFWESSLEIEHLKKPSKLKKRQRKNEVLQNFPK